MSETLQTIFNILAAGVVLFLAVILFKFFLRYAWKVLRAALIILALIAIAGFFFGFFEFTIN